MLSSPQTLLGQISPGQFFPQYFSEVVPYCTQLKASIQSPLSEHDSNSPFLGAGSDAAAVVVVVVHLVVVVGAVQTEGVDPSGTEHVFK